MLTVLVRNVTDALRGPQIAKIQGEFRTRHVVDVGGLQQQVPAVVLGRGCRPQNTGGPPVLLVRRIGGRGHGQAGQIRAVQSADELDFKSVSPGTGHFDVASAVDRRQTGDQPRGEGRIGQGRAIGPERAD